MQQEGKDRGEVFRLLSIKYLLLYVQTLNKEPI